MKKFYLAGVFVIATLFCLAQNTSNLTISTTGTSNLKIQFNNRKYSLPDRSVTFQSLQPGTYPLTIFQLQPKRGGGSEYIKVFDKTITLTAQKHLEIAVLRFGKTYWDENYIERDDWNENYNNPSPVRDNGHGRDYNDRDQPATAAQFEAIKRAISNEFSDANKLATAKVVLKNNLLTTDQIKTLANLFFSDSNKLEFAKYAYDYCYDKGSYFTVAEVLFSSTNRRELLDYIGNK